MEKRNSMIIADEDVGEMIVIDNKLEVKRGNKSLGNNSYSDKEKPQPKRDNQERGVHGYVIYFPHTSVH